jgi:archaemetzincin
VLFIIPAVAVVAIAVVLQQGDHDVSERRHDLQGNERAAETRTATESGDPLPSWALDQWGDFAPLPKPGPNDWLSVHAEAGQSFEQFVRSWPNRPGDGRTSLFLQPLGSFASSDAPAPDTLRRFAESFFGVTTEVLPELDIDLEHVTSRHGDVIGSRQLLTGDLLDLLRQRLPDRAFCVVGITLEDLYPGPDWNYVFGQASLRDRVAVYSFARYRPSFWKETVADARQLVLRRSCKVLAHETAHAFGVRHCTAHLCLMNGSNHLEESDARPLHLCPVDLRKLQWSVGFDVFERYGRLLELYEELGLDEDAAWIRRRLSHLGGRSDRDRSSDRQSADV